MLKKSLIKVQTTCQTQKEVFQEIATLAVREGLATDEEAVVLGLENREKESTTGFTDGFAIPHTKSEAIQKPGIVIIVNEQGIEWNSMDDKPAKFFISLLIPEQEAGTTHLNLLAAISRMLVHDEVREALLKTKSAEDIFIFFKEQLEEHLDE